MECGNFALNSKLTRRRIGWSSRQVWQLSAVVRSAGRALTSATTRQHRARSFSRNIGRIDVVCAHTLVASAVHRLPTTAQNNLHYKVH